LRQVAKEELEEGLTRLGKGMEKGGWEAWPVVEKVGCWYPGGTWQDGLLFVGVEGKPLLMVRREVERARVEWPLEAVVGKVEPPMDAMARSYF
jgi:Xaa-Pro dipeptidase